MFSVILDTTEGEAVDLGDLDLPVSDNLEDMDRKLTTIVVTVVYE